MPFTTKIYEVGIHYTDTEPNHLLKYCTFLLVHIVWATNKYFTAMKAEQGTKNYGMSCVCLYRNCRFVFSIAMLLMARALHISLIHVHTAQLTLTIDAEFLSQIKISVCKERARNRILSLSTPS